MDLGLRGKTVIISGGSKGIGRAISEEFGREGARVAIAARGRAALDETVAAIQAAGGEATGIVADMTKADAVNAAVARAAEIFGPPDIAISNIDAPDARRGSGFHVSFDSVDDAELQQAVDEMMMSVVYLTRAVLPAMKERRWGRLINIGSHAAKEPHAPPNQMLFSNVGRLGVVGLMKTLSYEYGIYNITANFIATGSFNTELSSSYFAKNGLTIEALEAGMRQAGVGACRLGRPEELAALAVFLASERASFVSGEAITVTGGTYQGTF